MELHIENIFTNNDIDNIWQSPDPLYFTKELLEKFLRIKGIQKIDPDAILVLSEFHVNNIIFLKENLNLSIDNYTKIINLFGILLDVKGLEPNFSFICKKKINDIRIGLNILNITSLDNQDISKILRYISSSYIPFIRLYYNYINKERKIEDKKIGVIINRPITIQPLNYAKDIITPKPLVHIQEEQKNITIEKNEEHDNKIEIVKDEIKETYLDIMNKLNLSENVKSVIKTRIENLHKEIEDKINDRQKLLDDKLKDIEDSIKGKKK